VAEIDEPVCHYGEQKGNYNFELDLWEWGVQRNGIPIVAFAMRKAVGPYRPLARSLIIEERSSRKAGMYATAC
jgi:hypothetical protein